ncbi:MAG: DUF4921 family protein [Deltaproteobacteria bacterium]|nr:DUF4921 family protein [Deltaproteobacteria bacterium]
MNSERALGTRTVFENDAAYVWAPFASRFPYETHVIPKGHAPSFEGDPGADSPEAAAALSAALRALKARLGDFSFNMILHTRPYLEAGPYHWHWEISTRLARVAGFERATDMYINAVPPETAAKELRAAFSKIVIAEEA